MNITKKIDIRIAVNEDIESIASLFNTTIRIVNAKDYSPEEIEVWASCSKRTEGWVNKIRQQTFYVAEINGVLVGFSSIEKDGYLDFMYVHNEYQKQGIAKELLLAIERKANKQNNHEIYAYVSKTAKSFFEKHGYMHNGNKTNSINGIDFVNSIMVKNLK